MKIFAATFVSALLLFGSGLFVSAASFNSEELKFLANANPDETKLISALIEDFSRATNIVTVPFTVYHYAPVTQLGLPVTASLKENNPAGFQYAYEKMESFWQNSSNRGQAGNGMYFATDPVETRSYGRTQFLLIQVQVRPGLAILDSRALRFKKSAELLQKMHCQVEFRNTEPLCAPYIKLAFKAMNLIGFEYAYSTDVECEKRGTAFVLTSPDLIGKKSIHLLTNYSNFNDPATKALAQNTFELIKKSGNPDSFKEWGATFSKVKLNEKDISLIFNQELISCPKVSAHIKPLFHNGYSSAILGKLAETETALLEVNNKRPILSVYHGIPMIDVDSIHIESSVMMDMKTVVSKQSRIDLLASISSFCDGLTSCSYFSDKKFGFVKIAWNCFAGSETVTHTDRFYFNGSTVAHLTCKQKGEAK